MAKPATDARLEAAAKGFTQVIGRGNAHIITRNPTTKKCCFDGQVGGGWHYNGDHETDTAWLPGTAPWNYQMTKANYNVFALSQFNSGQIIKWVDPGSGQYVTFQPMALQWTNALNQIQQISMPQSVAAQVNDDILYWPAAYGSGRNFRYQASPLRLNKQLIIDSPSALPATSYDILQINFIISASSGVNIMVDGAAWNKKTTKDTANAIAFQLSSGAVLWSFAVPRAWDSSGLPEGSTTGNMRLKKQGNSLYVSVRFPKAWIDSISQDNYPIIFDPTIDYQTGASADDGKWSSSTYDNDDATVDVGYYFGTYYNTWARFTGVTIPSGATIDASYLSFYSSAVAYDTEMDVYAEDSATPAAPTSYSDANGKTKTTAYVDTVIPLASWAWVNTGSLNTVVQELVNSYNFSTGLAMQFLLIAEGSRYCNIRQYNYSGNTYGPKLHIEYTEAAAGKPAGNVIWIG